MTSSHFRVVCHSKTSNHFCCIAHLGQSITVFYQCTHPAAITSHYESALPRSNSISWVHDDVSLIEFDTTELSIISAKEKKKKKEKKKSNTETDPQTNRETGEGREPGRKVRGGGIAGEERAGGGPSLQVAGSGRPH